MDVLLQIVFQLIKMFTTLYLAIVILRFLLQQVRADFYNPLSQFIVKATNPVLLPLRKIVPGFFGVDFSSIVLAILVAMLAVQLLAFVAGGGLLPASILLAGTLYKLVIVLFYIYFFAFLLIFIVSWVAPHSHNPAMSLVMSITEPVLAPVRKVIPPMGGLDFSLMFAGLAMWILFTIFENISLMIKIKMILGPVL